MSNLKKVALLQVNRNPYSESHANSISVSTTNSGRRKSDTFFTPNRIISLKIAICNARTLLSEEKLFEMEKELNENKWDIDEVSREGDNLTILKSQHIFIVL